MRLDMEHSLPEYMQQRKEKDCSIIPLQTNYAQIRCNGTHLSMECWNYRSILPSPNFFFYFFDVLSRTHFSGSRG